jgi:hypothetical protein
MSRLATALHAQPPGSWIDRKGAALARMQTLLDQHEQCKRAFFQDPCPRLGRALESLETAIANEKRYLARLEKRG